MIKMHNFGSYHRQHGSTAPVVRPTAKSMGKGEFWPPMTSISPKFYNFQLNVNDYIQEIYSSAIFHVNPFSEGFSPYRRNITVL